MVDERRDPEERPVPHPLGISNHGKPGSARQTDFLDSSARSLGGLKRAAEFSFPGSKNFYKAGSPLRFPLAGGRRQSRPGRVMEYIHALADAALRNGQRFFRARILPFRMTEASMKRYADSDRRSFWENLKEGYDLFEETGDVMAKDEKYVFEGGGERMRSITTDSPPSIPTRVP